MSTVDSECKRLRLPKPLRWNADDDDSEKMEEAKAEAERSRCWPVWYEESAAPTWRSWWSSPVNQSIMYGDCGWKTVIGARKVMVLWSAGTPDALGAELANSDE